MLALSFITIALFLLMTRYRVWFYAAASGALFSLVLWSLMDFINVILPTEWHGLSAFLAMLCIYFIVFGVVFGYQKWQHYKHN